MQLFSFTLPGWVSPADAFCLLYAGDEKAFWLDREHHPTAAFSVLGHAYRGETFDFANALLELDSMQASIAAEAAQQEFPFKFRPGLLGWLGYRDSGQDLDATPTQLMLVREALVFDHARRQVTMIGLFENESAFRQWQQGVTLRIWFAGGQSVGYQMRVASQNDSPVLAPRSSESEYLALINRAQQRIAAGDIYQLCLTNTLSGQTTRDPLATFLRLRQENPAPMASYIRIGSTVLVSSSPEHFLSLDAGGTLTTKPIKGTRGRLDDVDADDRIREELRTDPKERAENLMIVDLMRNDLGRVSEPDSVMVDELFEVESYATVHQLVSTVSARVGEGFGLREILDSTFPAGSMTGAPKLRAMELIAEFEGEPRGVYSGVAGWFGFDGAFDLAMNIRALVFRDGRVSIGVGGGITSDSVPAREFEETKLKATALLRAIDASCDW